MSEGASNGPPRVVTVVLNWNGADLTRKCVEHLRAQTAPSHVIIIDNGSVDGSSDALADLAGPNCDLMILPSNLGFSGGCNLGVRRAVALGATYVWLVNNDAFAERHCLALLLDCMDGTKEVAIATPRLLNLDGSEQHAGGNMNWWTGDPRPIMSNALAAVAPGNRWITGTAPIIRLSALAGEPPFRDEFFAYWEDVDLSLRMAARGYDLRVVPAATAVHMTRASTGGDLSPTYLYLMTRNLWLLQRAHLPARARPGAFLRFTATYFETHLGYARAGKQASAAAVLGGINAAWTGEVGAPPQKWRTKPLSLLVRHPWRAVQLMRMAERAFDVVLRSPVSAST